MMVMVVMIFGICWLPYHTYFIWSNIDPTINMSKYIQVKYSMFQLLDRINLGNTTFSLVVNDNPFYIDHCVVWKIHFNFIVFCYRSNSSLWRVKSILKDGMIIMMPYHKGTTYYQVRFLYPKGTNNFHMPFSYIQKVFNHNDIRYYSMSRFFMTLHFYHKAADYYKSLNCK